MRNSLSSLLVRSLELNSGKKILGTKESNKWVWRDKDYLLQTTQYCMQ